MVRSCDDAVEMNDARSSYAEEERGVAQLARPPDPEMGEGSKLGALSAEVPAEIACERGCEARLVAFIRGLVVTPENAVCNLGMEGVPEETVELGRGVDSSVLGVSAVGVPNRLGWGVGNFMRGRVVELMTERRKERLRVCGVRRSSCCWTTSSCSSSCFGAGVERRSLGGEGNSNRARGRGKARVGVKATDCDGDEKVVVFCVVGFLWMA